MRNVDTILCMFEGFLFLKNVFNTFQWATYLNIEHRNTKYQISCYYLSNSNASVAIDTIDIWIDGPTSSREPIAYATA